MTEIAKQYGVSDTAVKKWCKKFNIPILRKRGDWAKIYAKNRAVV